MFLRRNVKHGEETKVFFGGLGAHLLMDFCFSLEPQLCVKRGMAVYEINTLKSDTIVSTDTVTFRYCHYNVLSVIFYCIYLYKIIKKLELLMVVVVVVAVMVVKVLVVVVAITSKTRLRRTGF